MRGFGNGVGMVVVIGALLCNRGATAGGGDRSVGATMTITVVGGSDVVLVDPGGRMDLGGDSIRAGIPECQRVENTVFARQPAEGRETPRTTFQLNAVTAGTYRIGLRGPGGPVSIVVESRNGELICESRDLRELRTGEWREWTVKWVGSPLKGGCKTHVTRAGRRLTSLSHVK